MARFRILVVDDDPVVIELVTETLTGAGYDVQAASSASAARSFLGRGKFDLAVLDRKLPDGDGMSLCVEMRDKPALRDIPVLFLTARSAVEDRVTGLRSGGDDYLVKPFDLEELFARVEALLRRSGRTGQPENLQAGALKLEMDARRVCVKEKPLDLSAKEFDLLTLFVRLKERVLSRDFLLQQVWGYPAGAATDTKIIDVTIHHLREKLGAYGERIVTVRSHGYRFDP
ncbi:MAG: response regulator transcription factor [Elusimicrobia bacterium]|nr:response regulator transcription factor [Elusimicrobiota bacterium]